MTAGPGLELFAYVLARLCMICGCDPRVSWRLVLCVLDGKRRGGLLVEDRIRVCVRCVLSVFVGIDLVVLLPADVV